MPTRPLLRLVAVVVAVLATGCGGSPEKEEAPDEATFCRLAQANDPVAESDLIILERLDLLAPEDIDPAVVVLRDGAAELAELTPRSPEAITLEFEIRFRPEFIAARRELEAYVEAECDPVVPATVVPPTEPSKTDDDREKPDSGTTGPTVPTPSVTSAPSTRVTTEP